MEHHHNHSNNIDLSNAFKTGIAINVVFIAIEAFYGFSSNSMALVADAGHNLSDVFTLLFSWLAVMLSKRKPTLNFTYGFRRSTFLVALINSVLVFVAVAFIIWETIDRIGEHFEIKSENVIIIATIGIAVNGITAWLFMKGKKHDLNIRAAFVHFFADALVSLGVVVAGFIMLFTGIYWIDSVVSFVIIAVILYSSYHLLIDSVKLSLDAVPENINISEVREFLVSLQDVSGIHDLHIWSISTTEAALTAHITTQTNTDAHFVIDIKKQLSEKFNITHATIQVEFGIRDIDCDDKCN